jgi:eukaryotic-like serine/threonine-protein kinase
MKLAPGTKLGPYEILAPIGAGGMGEVWRARDTRLGRIVAIKKVKEQHSERFKQEARSIAALNHPNICQLHDIGPDYLILEYVEGKPLSCPLPEREAVRPAIQIATALEEAHRNGIIHRDLKPSNIMVTEKGSVKLLDFGLSKLYEQNAGESTAEFPATQAGAVLGTVAYMSPEQAQGQQADARSDIFSFGLVLHEMLSGRRAFQGGSNPAILAALMRDEPSPLQASGLLEKIVRRCLEKQPTKRYQTMAEVRADLEQCATAKAAITGTEPQPSIAVLPFVNMSGDKEQEYFSDGLAEEIINALTQIPGLKVTARTSAFAFKDKREDITKIAEALRVSNILEGSVRKAGNRIRVTAQLITAADGSHLWSERYDREMTDIFAIQDEISLAIAEKLRMRISGNRSHIRRHTENLEAYNLYLKARHHHYKFAPEDFAKSQGYYKEAIELDPNYALAWAGLASTYWSMGMQGCMHPKTVYAQCRQAAVKALELDETLAEAHSIIAALLGTEFDWKGSKNEFRRALELDPTSDVVLGTYSLHYLMPMQHMEEAIAVSRKGLELNPLSPMSSTIVGMLYVSSGQADRAIEQFRRTLQLDPNFYLAYFYLSFAYIIMGNFDEGIRTLETASQLSGRNPQVLGHLGAAYARVGRIGEAQKILKELEDIAQDTYVPATTYAIVYMGLGQTERAFDWLDKAVDERDFRMHYLRGMPVFQPLYSHPRFHALLRRMNLEP